MTVSNSLYKRILSGSSSKKKRLLLAYLTCITLFFIALLVIGWKTEDWNGIHPDNDNTLWEKIRNRFYFSAITFSTIGYGDITPKSHSLRILTAIMAIATMIIIFTI